MTQETKVSCDYCHRDLTEDNGANDWRLCLEPQRLSPSAGPRLAVVTFPPLSHARHFCDFRCLVDWMGTVSETATLISGKDSR